MAVIIPLLLVALLGEVGTGGIDAKGVALLGSWGRVVPPCASRRGYGGLRAHLLLAVPGRLRPRSAFRLPAWGAHLVRLRPDHRRGRTVVALPDDGGRVDRLRGRPGPPATGPSRAHHPGFVCGGGLFVYGLLTNLWFWPFGAGTTTAFSFQPGASLGHNLVRFLGFDVTTSLGFDIPTAVVNAALVLTVGRPVIAALRRASHRAAFGATVEVPGPGSDDVALAPASGEQG